MILLTCSSHEDRCFGILKNLGKKKPTDVVIFHYNDKNVKRENNHKKMEEYVNQYRIKPTNIPFAESDAVISLHENMDKIQKIIDANNSKQIVFDISVFTKRHLLIMLRWLDDKKLWEKLTVVYCEPEDYDVSQFIPLSFGLSCIQQIPGYSACPDLSRPVHLVLFLGYEGDRSLAVYEDIQPMQTTIIIPYPPYKPSWEGRTETFNAPLLKIIGNETINKVDAIDPDKSSDILKKIFGNTSKHGTHAKIICPLGTKPQTLGIYGYTRQCIDPPAIIYASPLRHNHNFYSHGIGKIWILKQP